MKKMDLHPIPTFHAVLVEQIRIVGPTLRIQGIIFGALFALGPVMILFSSTPYPINFDLNYFVLSIVALVGVAMPLFLWRGTESPFQPGFPWTLPVERAQHAIARVGAGWIWLMMALVVFMLWRAVNTLLSGGALTGSESWLLAAPAGTVADRMDPATMTPVVWSQPGWLLLVPFVGATGVYFLISALFLATRYPGRWIMGTVIGLPIVALINAYANPTWLAEALDSATNSFLGGRYGLSTFIGGGTFEASATRMPSGEEVFVWMNLPTFGRWSVAVALWAGAALVALALALRKHRDGRGSQAST